MNRFSWKVWICSKCPFFSWTDWIFFKLSENYIYNITNNFNPLTWFRLANSFSLQSKPLKLPRRLKQLIGYPTFPLFICSFHCTSLYIFWLNKYHLSESSSWQLEAVSCSWELGSLFHQRELHNEAQLASLNNAMSMV